MSAVSTILAVRGAGPRRPAVGSNKLEKYLDEALVIGGDEDLGVELSSNAIVKRTTEDDGFGSIRLLINLGCI